jgi:8-oxo-dGTP diphosphatase
VAVPIGIAVVEHNGTYLVGRRGTDGPLPGLDEFPGGKCRLDEPPRECACRECLEETGMRVEPVELILNRQFDYPHATIDLFFWRCRLRDEADFSKVREPFRWVQGKALAELSFPEANAPLIERLIAR